MLHGARMQMLRPRASERQREKEYSQMINVV
jgi:hypothetical protein